MEWNFDLSDSVHWFNHLHQTDGEVPWPRSVHSRSFTFTLLAVAVIDRFDGSRAASDGGAILLREMDRVLGLTRRMGGCFADGPGPRRVDHRDSELVAQQVHGVAAHPPVVSHIL